MSAPGEAFEDAMLAIAGGDRAAADDALGEASRAYYGTGDSPLADAEWDDLAASYRRAFGAPYAAPRRDRRAEAAQVYPDLACFIDAELHSREDLLAWASPAMAAVPGAVLAVSAKWDGLSVVVAYGPGGEVESARTRGDDGLGVDVTSMFEGEVHYPGLFPGERYGVKYEAVMTWGAVAELSAALGREYKNPRNTVAGCFSADDRRERRRFVTLAPLDYQTLAAARGAGPAEPRRDRIGYMRDAMLPVFAGNGGRPAPFRFELAASLQAAARAAEAVGAWRDSEGQDFMVDGAVVEFADGASPLALGGAFQRPGWVAKYKFPPPTAQTEAVSLDWDVGATGRATPVVNVRPVRLNGNTYQRVSLSNVARFDQLRLCPGTPLRFELRNDTLGWVDRSGPDPEGAAPFPEVEGATFTVGEAGERVFAYVEAPLHERCVRMLVKCGVKGVKEASLQRLVEAGLVSSLADVWRLDEAAVAALPGMGPASAALLCGAVREKRAAGVRDWELLASLGIPGIGRTIARAALAQMSLGEIADFAGLQGPAAAAALLAAGGSEQLGPERARLLVDGLLERWDEAVAVSGEVQVLQTRPEAGGEAPPPAPLPESERLTIVVTGELEGWPGAREEFVRLVESMGHRVTGSVSRKTSFLVTNHPSERTNKLRKAQSLGVPVIPEGEALRRLGIEPPARGPAPPAAGGPEEAALGDL